MKKIALIPAYEPEETLITLIDNLKVENFQILVVDDGSGAKYAPIFARASQIVTVLTHEVNMGKGKAIKTGLTYIQKNFDSDSVVVTLDADGQHKVSDAQKICVEAEKFPGFLILGSRTFGDKVPLRSRMGNGITRFVYRIITGIAVHDTQTGLRAFTFDMIPFMLGIEGDRYEYEMNVLLVSTRKKISIKEIDIETLYFDNNQGSHFSTIRDSFRVYKNILKFAASSITGFIIDYMMYSILVLVTGAFGMSIALSVPLSNVIARITSSSVNFTINKKLVFKNQDSTLKTGIQYFALALCILIGNTFLLSYLVEKLGVNKYAGKLVTELTFFTFSWLIQKFVIFRKKDVQ